MRVSLIGLGAYLAAETKGPGVPLDVKKLEVDSNWVMMRPKASQGIRMLVSMVASSLVVLTAVDSHTCTMRVCARPAGSQRKVVVVLISRSGKLSKSTAAGKCRCEVIRT